MSGKTRGFAAKAELYCSTCENGVVEDYLCRRVANSDSMNVPFEVNSKAVLAFRGVGCEFSSIKEWCGIMNMPYHLSQDTYTNTHSKINVASKETFKEVQDTAVTVDI